jgi:hypothetical protein
VVAHRCAPSSPPAGWTPRSSPVCACVCFVCVCVCACVCACVNVCALCVCVRIWVSLSDCVRLYKCTFIGTNVYVVQMCMLCAC